MTFKKISFPIKHAIIRPYGLISMISIPSNSDLSVLNEELTSLEVISN